jgi:K+-sensing histidine kinase KdpD
MGGKSRKARKYLDESLAVAEQQGAKFEHAQSLWARGQVGSAVGWAEASADLEQGRDALRKLGAYWVLGETEPSPPEQPVMPALIERFDALLQAGRRIASAMTRDAVYESVRAAALAILRGDECRLVGVQARAIADPEPQDGYSRTVVQRAIETKRPVVATDQANDDPSESLVLAGARSVLCAPIAVRGTVVACVYVSHQRVDGLFGPDEERMAEFITTLAGAALENVEGMTKAESDLIAGTTAGLAHAIKSPVAVLRTYLGMLRGAERDGSFDRYLHTMEDALNRISELVGRLQGAQVRPPEKVAIGVEQLIDDAVSEVRPLFPSESAYAIDRHSVSGAPATIVADREQLRLVLVNLLVNAHQAMPRGGRVEVAVRAGSGPTVELSITDQGAGPSPVVESRLFEPFVTSKADGTGLGLWVCKKIVEDHHQGRIELHRVPGGGTVVRVVLPVGSDAAAALF